MLPLAADNYYVSLILLTIIKKCSIISVVSNDTIKEIQMNTSSRVESREEVKAYLANLRYALNQGAKIEVQLDRMVDQNRDPKYTNRNTIANLFPDESPETVMRRELQLLTVEEYMRTIKDLRFPKRSEMREFGKVYNGSDEVYIKIRVELIAARGFGEHTTFVMSFHYAIKPFSQEIFPYSKKGGAV